ncbi:unnamed protein product [Chironomus riparius]|uniref:ZAD domain-containing protein n=1 Tax=Chironomus riparius TaxID=315576 RepID=A0A9N9RX87_9DIPT|nr:unnamed protein product [Chironomus riparius]
MNNIKEQKICLLCNVKIDLINEFVRISDNFIKIDSTYTPFHEILRDILSFDELNNQIISSAVCKICHSRVLDFYNFKIKCKANITVQFEKIDDSPKELDENRLCDNSIVFTTVQIVKNYIKKYSVQEIKENESTKELVIRPREKSNEDEQVSSSTSINAFQGQENNSSIKDEPVDVNNKAENVEVKIEPMEIKEEGLPGDILGIDIDEFTSQEENTSSSSDNYLYKLPAFQENRIFDGNRFVSRSEIIQRKSSKEQHKKRARRPDLWAATVQKKLRTLGQPYRSVKGYLVAAKTVGPPCNCKKDCSNKVNESNRSLNFKEYWRLECINEKKKFILNHIKLVRPQRALTKNRAYSRIMHHFLDVLNYDGSSEQIKVCKKMFCQTLNISNSVITNAFKIKDQYLDIDKC